MLRNTRQHFGTRVGANSEITNKKHNAKNMALTRPGKGTCSQYELKGRGKHHLCDPTSPGHVHEEQLRFSTALHLFTVTMKAL